MGHFLIDKQKESVCVCEGGALCKRLFVMFSYFSTIFAAIL